MLRCALGALVTARLEARRDRFEAAAATAPAAAAAAATAAAILFGGPLRARGAGASEVALDGCVHTAILLLLLVVVAITPLAVLGLVVVLVEDLGHALVPRLRVEVTREVDLRQGCRAASHMLNGTQPLEDLLLLEILEPLELRLLLGACLGLPRLFRLLSFTATAQLRLPAHRRRIVPRVTSQCRRALLFVSEVVLSLEVVRAIFKVLLLVVWLSCGAGRRARFRRACRHVARAHAHATALFVAVLVVLVGRVRSRG